jgi:hypothetical protein
MASRVFRHFTSTGRAGLRVPSDPGLASALGAYGSADAFMKLATPCTILSLWAVTASFVMH